MGWGKMMEYQGGGGVGGSGSCWTVRSQPPKKYSQQDVTLGDFRW